MADVIQLNDIGTVFDLTLTDDGVAVNISAATTMEILLRKPDETAATWTAAFKTDGTDGIITYTTIAADLDQIGTWRLQARIVEPSIDGRSEVGFFQVEGNV